QLADDDGFFCAIHDDAPTPRVTASTNKCSIVGVTVWIPSNGTAAARRRDLNSALRRVASSTTTCTPSPVRTMLDMPSAPRKASYKRRGSDDVIASTPLPSLLFRFAGVSQNSNFPSLSKATR